MRLHPRDAKDVAEAIQAAISRKESFEIVAGGTRRSLGRPIRADAILDVSGIAGIIDYEPSELILTARPGTAIKAIADLLAQHGQCLAFEPGLESGATLGGALAVGDSGSRRPFAGAARDHFLGCTAISGRGEIFKAGGKVVKNVTGYDLPKLMAGSFGTLAVMSEITIKVLPRPEICSTLAVDIADFAEGLSLLRRIAAGPHDVSGLALFRNTIFIRLEGTEISVRARRGALGLDGAEVGNDIWSAFGQGSIVGPSEVLWRVSCPASRADSFLPLAASGSFAFDWAGARMWWSGNGSADAGAAALRTLLDGRGHATLIRGPDALRLAVPPLQPEPASLAALTRRVKQSFDPEGVLNSGRMYEGI